MLTKKYFVIIALTLNLALGNIASASGLFGPPETVSRRDGGLNTAVGYWYSDRILQNVSDYKFRQNEIYSQASYGSRNIWEVYGRIGVADLKIADAFRSASAATAVSTEDFTENWKLFGTLGAKGFLPVNEIFGLGAFVQFSYYFNNFTAEVTGTSSGTPFAADLKIRNMWDANFGLGMQFTLPRIKLYAGPYVHYAEARANLSHNIAGIEFGAESVLLKSRAFAGGFVGTDIPLAKGFHLNIEGRYSERLSLGAAVSYTY